VVEEMAGVAEGVEALVDVVAAAAAAAVGVDVDVVVGGDAAAAAGEVFAAVVAVEGY
jgi:hypothetical protein